MGEAAGKPIPVQEFIAGLNALRDFEPLAVYSYIKTHPVESQTLQPYLFFDPKSYTRNLIIKNDTYELLALCWEVGQVSRIHNHREQQCWMAVPVGKLKNQNFQVLDRDPVKKTCRLVPSASFLITPTSPLEVDQEEPVHQVMNLREFNSRAISLHVYSRPFSTCEVYQIDRGTYTEVNLQYTSEYGKLLSGQASKV